MCEYVAIATDIYILGIIINIANRHLFSMHLYIDCPMYVTFIMQS